MVRDLVKKCNVIYQTGYPLNRENRKWQKQRIPCQGKHREFGNFDKTQEIRFAKFGNSMILKVRMLP